MNRVFRLVPALAAALILAACVAGSSESGQAASGGLVALLALGLWHGIIGPITLLVEVINALLPHVLPWKAHLYEAKAAGAPYDVGFCIGFGAGPIAVWRRWGTGR